MKQIISVIIITIIFIALSIYSNKYLKDSAENMTSHIDKVEAYAKVQDWSNVKRELSSIEDIWSKLQNQWAMLIEHEEIDKLEMSLSKVSKYAEAKSFSDCLAENANLKLLIKHIPEIHVLNLKNVF